MDRLIRITMANVWRIQIETSCASRPGGGQFLCDHDHNPIGCIEALRSEKVNCVVCTLACKFDIRRVTGTNRLVFRGTCDSNPFLR